MKKLNSLSDLGLLKDVIGVTKKETPKEKNVDKKVETKIKHTTKYYIDPYTRSLVVHTI